MINTYINWPSLYNRRFSAMLFMVILLHCLMFETSASVRIKGQTSQTSASVRFQEIVQMQKSHCTCASTKGLDYTSTCCGRCSCAESCYVQGNCCLEMFNDFQSALMVLDETR